MLSFVNIGRHNLAQPEACARQEAVRLLEAGQQQVERLLDRGQRVVAAPQVAEHVRRLFSDIARAGRHASGRDAANPRRIVSRAWPSSSAAMIKSVPPCTSVVANERRGTWAVTRSSAEGLKSTLVLAALQQALRREATTSRRESTSSQLAQRGDVVGVTARGVIRQRRSALRSGCSPAGRCLWRHSARPNWARTALSRTVPSAQPPGRHEPGRGGGRCTCAGAHKGPLPRGDMTPPCSVTEGDFHVANPKTAASGIYNSWPVVPAASKRLLQAARDLPAVLDRPRPLFIQPARALDRSRMPRLVRAEQRERPPPEGTAAPDACVRGTHVVVVIALFAPAEHNPADPRAESHCRWTTDRWTVARLPAPTARLLTRTLNETRRPSDLNQTVARRHGVPGQ